MKEQREWEVKRRQVESAARFNQAVMAAMSEAPTTVGPRKWIAERCGEARELLINAERKERLALDDPGLDRRAHALDMVLFIASNYRTGDEEVNPWCISVATRDLLKALDAFQLNRPPPEPEFPTAKELIGIVHKDGQDLGLQGINDHLGQRGVM